MRAEAAAPAAPAVAAPRLPLPALLAALFLAGLALATAAAPLVEAWLGVDARAVDLFNRLQPPSALHPLGTDELGRDVLARLLYGGRISLAVGIAGALLAAVIGTAIGVAAGMSGGRLDSLLMRATDAVIALPLLPLLIVLAAVDLTKLGLGPATAGAEWVSVVRITVIVALFGWTTIARLVRATILSLVRREFVTAARAMGAGPLRIALAHLLPNAATPIIVATTLSVGTVILTESVLSFLGLGIQPPLPSWGNMLTGAQDLLFEAPLLALWPGLLIFLTVVAVNLLGDGLSERLDPRARGG